MKKVRLSTNRVTTYYHCPRKYYLTYIEGYYPKGPAALPLQVGGITHTLKEMWIKDELPKKITVPWIVDLIQKESPENTEALINDVALQALGLFNAFLDKEGKTPLKYESSETVMELECKDYVLYTRIDGLVRTQDKRLWREETKTTAKLDSAYLSGLRSSLQAGIAYKVMKALVPEQVVGTIYTILVKTQIPKCERNMVGMERSLLKMTNDCLQGCIEGIKGERWSPSMNCYTYNRSCEYLPICKGATPGIIKNFFVRKEDVDGIVECS